MAAVREALTKVDGVKKVNVDFTNRKATVWMDKQEADPDKLLEAVHEAGFEKASLDQS